RQLLAHGGLGDVAVHPGMHHLHHVVSRRRHGESHELEFGSGGANQRYDRCAAATGELDVEHHQLRVGGEDPVHRRLHIGRLADDVELVGQDGLHPGAHDVVIVHEEDPEAHTPTVILTSVPEASPESMAT